MASESIAIDSEPIRARGIIVNYTLSCVGRSFSTYPFTNLISTDIPFYHPSCVDKSCAKVRYFVCAYSLEESCVQIHVNRTRVLLH